MKPIRAEDEEVDTPIKGYPELGERDPDDMPLEWSDEDRQIADRKPDLGELDGDPDAL